MTPYKVGFFVSWRTSPCRAAPLRPFERKTDLERAGLSPVVLFVRHLSHGIPNTPSMA